MNNNRSIKLCNKFDVFDLSETNNCSKNLLEQAFPYFATIFSMRPTCKGGRVMVFLKNMFLPYIGTSHSVIEECLFLCTRKQTHGLDHNVLLHIAYIGHECSKVEN